MDLTVISSIGIPLIMGVGGILAWRKTMKSAHEEEKPHWRDESLDDWHKERAAALEAEREARASGEKPGGSA